MRDRSSCELQVRRQMADEGRRQMAEMERTMEVLLQTQKNMAR